MHVTELKNFKHKLQCSFCRNSLANDEIFGIMSYSENKDYVFVMCDPCAKRYDTQKQWGPKFIICLCSDEPKELEIEMAKSEIENAKPSFKEEIHDGLLTLNDIDKGSDKTEVSTLSKKRRRSNTTRF